MRCFSYTLLYTIINRECKFHLFKCDDDDDDDDDNQDDLGYGSLCFSVTVDR